MKLQGLWLEKSVWGNDEAHSAGSLAEVLGGLRVQSDEALARQLTALAAQP